MSMANYGDQSRGFTYKYDVFLSFRGEDTRYSFIGYLYDALSQRGINVFIYDTNLRREKDISATLLKAIKESKISVIVFSKNYATSTWCLDDLVKIIECTKRNNNQIAFPIFYDVDLSDVRHQRNSYEEAMVAHQNRFGKDSEKIKAWKAALSEAADFEGYHIETGYEFDHIKEFVKKVEAKLGPKPFQTRQKLLNADNIWRLVGLVSSVVGLSCYALSPSFNRLIGTMKPFKFISYGVLSLVLFTTILFAKKSPSSTRHHQLKIYTTFAVLIIMAVYTFFYDRAVNGNPDILNVVSNAAFVLVSLSLHKLVDIGFEIGVFTYFLGCFAVQLFTINWMLIFIAILFGCPLFVMHSSSNSQPEVASGGRHSSPNSQPEVASGGQHVTIDIVS